MHLTALWRSTRCIFHWTRIRIQWRLNLGESIFPSDSISVHSHEQRDRSLWGPPTESKSCVAPRLQRGIAGGDVHWSKDSVLLLSREFCLSQWSDIHRNFRQGRQFRLTRITTDSSAIDRFKCSFVGCSSRWGSVSSRFGCLESGSIFRLRLEKEVKIDSSF